MIILKPLYNITLVPSEMSVVSVNVVCSVNGVSVVLVKSTYFSVESIEACVILPIEDLWLYDFLYLC